MTSTRSAPGGMARSMREEVLISGRMIMPFGGPRVIWNGANVKVGMVPGNDSVSVL